MAVLDAVTTIDLHLHRDNVTTTFVPESTLDVGDVIRADTDGNDESGRVDVRWYCNDAVEPTETGSISMHASFQLQQWLLTARQYQSTVIW